MTLVEPATHQRYTLWGGQLSVYTARVRCYLIKKGIPYRECYPADSGFAERILPAVGFFVIPVLETPQGEIIQDSSAIIEYLESQHPTPSFVPATPIQSAVTILLSAFGSEALNQPSMHYRWSFMGEQGEFIATEFGRAASSSRDPEERKAEARPSIALMQEHLPRLGISPATIPTIECAYLDLLDVLNTHFLMHPYLLGGRPSMADFGFMAGLYAHLSRDPVPSAIMKSRAPNVFRWTERMHIANIDDGEFPDAGDAYLADDEIPETLKPLLKLIFADWGVELLATASRFNTWCQEGGYLPAGTLVSAAGERAVHPSLGLIQYDFRGITMQRDCWPHSLWHFIQAQQAAEAISADSLNTWQSLLAETGGEEVMGLSLSRTMTRKDNVLVLQ